MKPPKFKVGDKVRILSPETRANMVYENFYEEANNKGEHWSKDKKKLSLMPMLTVKRVEPHWDTDGHTTYWYIMAERVGGHWQDYVFREAVVIQGMPNFITDDLVEGE